MTAITQHQPLELRIHKHDLVQISQIQPDTAIQCNEGVLWITCSGDQVQAHNPDILLSAGERYTPAENGRVVIEAMSEAGLSLIQEHPHRDRHLIHTLAG